MFRIILSKTKKETQRKQMAPSQLQVTCQALASGSTLGPTDCLLAGFMQPYPKSTVQGGYPRPQKNLFFLSMFPFVDCLFLYSN